MTNYLVLKRSRGDGWMPGEVLVDPIQADRLVQRGFIQEVPDNYVSKLSDAQERADKRAAKAEVKSEKEEVREEADITKEGEALLLANRPDAKKLAKRLGSPLDEVFELSDEEYAQGLELLDDNEPTDDGQPEAEPVGSVGAAAPAEGKGNSTEDNGNGDDPSGPKTVATIGSPG